MAEEACGSGHDNRGYGQPSHTFDPPHALLETNLFVNLNAR
jgi:hypothetical protein